METTLAGRLRNFIDSTGLTDKEFSESIECSKQELSNWLHGTKIGLNRIIKIKEVYPGFDVSWFITGERNDEQAGKEIYPNHNDLDKLDVSRLYKELAECQKTIIKLQKEKIDWLEERNKE